MSFMSHPAAPSVFISSTVREFRDLRSALYYNLRSQGISGYLSEASDFDVQGDRSAVEECLRNVRASDYYVLLIGGQRGSLIPEDGVSITRKEYRAAREQFVKTGKPVMLLFLRQEVEDALTRGIQNQEDSGIDDPEHLKEFIQEVQNPPVEGCPSYLRRFQDFSSVMEPITTRLNLGRNLGETLARYSLISELTWNISQLVERFQNGVLPHHWRVSDIPERISLEPNDTQTDVSGRDLKWLLRAALAVIGPNAISS